MVVVISIGMDSSPVNTSFNHVIKPKSHSSGESEAALIRMNEDGSILTATGTTPQGQGLFAALQIDERAGPTIRAGAALIIAGAVLLRPGSGSSLLRSASSSPPFPSSPRV